MILPKAVTNSVFFLTELLNSDASLSVKGNFFTCSAVFCVRKADLIKFIPNIEDPMRYYLIPRADIYYKIPIDIPPFGKGLMIWANSENIRLAEPAKPLRPQTVDATNEKKEETAGDLICSNCQYINKPGGLICEKCGLVFNAFYQ